MSLISDLLRLPVWLQLLSVGILILVGQFWFSQIGDKINTSGWRRSIWILLLKDLVISSLISWIAVNYCVGKGPNSMVAPWSQLDRILFIFLLLALTQFFTKYFSR